MSLRDEFEKSYLGANPHLARHNSTDDSYVLPSIQDAWVGFQAGHAAGLEKGLDMAGNKAVETGWYVAAEEIRAMKEQKK